MELGPESLANSHAPAMAIVPLLPGLHNACWAPRSGLQRELDLAHEPVEALDPIQEDSMELKLSGAGPLNLEAEQEGDVLGTPLGSGPPELLRHP
eukprot:3860769-Alexandrium_andersonii.AAC.1